MTAIAKITAKGQTAIPQDIRAALHVGAGLPGHQGPGNDGQTQDGEVPGGRGGGGACLSGTAPAAVKKRNAPPGGGKP
jgi:hypothetical protein